MSPIDGCELVTRIITASQIAPSSLYPATHVLTHCSTRANPSLMQDSCGSRSHRRICRQKFESSCRVKVHTASGQQNGFEVTHVRQLERLTVPFVATQFEIQIHHKTHDLSQQSAKPGN